MHMTLLVVELSSRREGEGRVVPHTGRDMQPAAGGNVERDEVAGRHVVARRSERHHEG